jgi:hypothetical protein
VPCSCHQRQIIQLIKHLAFAEFRELHSVSSKRLRAAELGKESTRVIRDIIQDILDKTLECMI